MLKFRAPSVARLLAATPVGGVIAGLAVLSVVSGAVVYAEPV